MIDRAWVRAALSFSIAVLAQACGVGDDSGDAEEGGGSSGGAAVFGDARPSGNRDVAERIATRAVDAAVSSCGESCSADVASGYASLADGHMLEAWKAFKCADNPEAAFGAGLARVLGVLESEAGDDVLSDFGLPHMPASDMFGPTGWLARIAARWNGSAQLAVTGGLALQIDSEHVSADDYQLELRTDLDTRRVTFTVETDESWSAGNVFTEQFNCANSTRLSSFPYVSLTVDDGPDQYDCQVPFMVSALTCMPTAGSLTVGASGQAQGDRVELELSDLLLECQHFKDSNQGVDTDTPLDVSTVRVSGRVAAEVTLEVDTKGLHPLFQDSENLLDGIPANVRGTTLMNHAAAVAGEIASARCYFAKAAEGTGTVFTLPGALYGGHDLALGAGDARMLGSASGLTAAAIELATSYEIDMPLQHVVCTLDDGEGEGERFASCGTMQALVDTLNAKIHGAKVRHDRLSAARALLAVGLDDFELGVQQLDDHSALVHDPVSAPGWDIALELVHAAQASLVGRTAVPHLSPAAHLDLNGFFASPPNPAAIAQPLLAFEQQCEDLGNGQSDCITELQLQVQYLNAFFAPHSDIDWNDGDYEWTASDQVEDALRQISAQLRTKGLTLDD